LADANAAADAKVQMLARADTSLYPSKVERACEPPCLAGIEPAC
jgi:hypothetical protein